MNKYIHTIDGEVAQYHPGEQICYARQGAKLSDLLVSSLAEIKQQQRASSAWRHKRGMDDVLGESYGYLRVKV